ncbi:class I SAM-dependent methyltransferase [Acidovorax lacteus]|uniref:Class I SAM-dependent methyltransferase n=1 Tax=Acidovorax lacteus TaxID=1924988 RepID=A0ABP8LHI9_9BURK
MTAVPAHTLPDSPLVLRWAVGETEHTALWRSEAGVPPPARVLPVDDTVRADAAYRAICEGAALLWQGDFHNARQLLSALARRLERRPAARGRAAAAAGSPADAAQAFYRHRQEQGRRARVLAAVLVPLEGDYAIALRRAPDWRAACAQAWGPPGGQPSVVSLRELLGLNGAFEWRRKGVPVPALGPEARIHPHYGVFSPVRGEYIDLVAQAPLPAALATHPVAVDLGVGTGVLSAVLAQRGAGRVLATDLDPRALACAAENLAQLGLSARVQLLQADLYPPGVQAGLVVCNPPWLPAKPSAPVERAVYDEGSRMLRGFLAGLRAHLAPGGEGWLILSDLAEHLGLRTRAELLAWVQAAGLRVLGRIDTRPRHPKAQDASDPLHAARAAERTSLWRLGAA